MKIAYQGIRGAYSESAVYRHFGREVQAIGLETFHDVIEAVKLKEADLGVLPFENTIAGSIAVNYDLLLKSGLAIIGEIFVDIKTSLLSHKGNTLENIKKVYSHPHALEESRKFLTRHNIKAIPEYDTAGAAKLVAEKKDNSEAAIASELCAEIYGLEIMKSSLDSGFRNTTRFFVLAGEGNIPADIRREKTTIAFKTKDYPGALVNCLQRLSKNNINMTKLESRPIPENPWEYMFYVDIQGGTDNEDVKLSIKEIEASSEFIKVLGSYPDGRKQQEN